MSERAGHGAGMIEEEAFLRALLASPEDAALHGVYADWLEERGDARAAYLRDGGGDVTAFDPGWVAFMQALDQPLTVETTPGGAVAECIHERTPLCRGR